MYSFHSHLLGPRLRPVHIHPFPLAPCTTLVGLVPLDFMSLSPALCEWTVGSVPWWASPSISFHTAKDGFHRRRRRRGGWSKRRSLLRVMEVDVPPNQTLYVQNLQEKLKKEGEVEVAHGLEAR